MHLRSFVITLAVVALSAVAFGQPGNIPAAQNPGVLLDAYQIAYISNPSIGAGWINMTNAGQLGADAFGPGAGTTGRICANVYAFEPDEQEIACCYCLVTPNALIHLTVFTDILSNTLTGVVPSSVVIKLLATIPGATAAVPGSNTQTTFTGSACNPAQPFTTANLAPGLRAWAVKLHALPTSPVTYGVSETAFLPANLSQGELTKITNLCQFIFGNGSGPGQCKNCVLSSGGLGGSKQ
jgi:hypothetical protein